MRILDWLSRRSAPRNFDDVIRRLDGAVLSSGTGIHVSTDMALQVGTVFACIRVLAEGCATPELQIFREKEDGRREKATDAAEYRIFNRRPNEWQTSFEFRRMMTMHAALTGNALAIKVKVNGRLRELIPVKPGQFHIDRVDRYRVVYRVYDDFGLIGDFGPDDVFHLPGVAWDLVKGLDAVRIAASAIGLAHAAEENQASLHKNGGRPAGILSTDVALSVEAATRIKEAFKAFTSSDRNGTAILDNKMSYTPLSVSGVDAQHLETRRFQVEEICRPFGVFPIMIGHSDETATFASAEAFFGAHRIQTMMPWWTLWTQRIDEFALDGKGPLFAEFDTRYLQAGSMRDRAQWARTMAELGIYTRNELRDEEGRDPLPGLDEPLTPLNMTQASSTKDAQNETQV